MMKVTLLGLTFAGVANAAGHTYERVEWGPRIPYLVDDMEESELKTSLTECLNNPAIEPAAHDFSIGHRGACMQFPEHTAESYEAAVYQGAGIVECDVAVTMDGELVCRHSQCDLHTTTNIVATELGAKCTVPFTPANATAGTPATATCCTSDITLAEYKTLCGKMDASDSSATTPEAYLGGTAAWRTDLYATCATVVSHAESIALIDDAHRKFTPELKSYTQGDLPFEYDAIRAKLIQEYIDAGVPATSVWPQSFVAEDVFFWIANYPETFGPQAVYLDNAYCDGTAANCAQIADFAAWKAAGVEYYAPPMQMLVQVTDEAYAASELALAAKAAGLNIITWTLERSGPLVSGGGWYYGTSNDFTNNDGDMLELVHTLATDVGVAGIFSDWPATTTFYANCMIAVDSTVWYKKRDPSKNCAWVAQWAPRCDAKGWDNTLAREACAASC